MQGGCACGAVRYRLTEEPIETSWCHCRNCQRIAGAPAAVYTTLPRTGLAFERGESDLGNVSLTSTAKRLFCSQCGSPIATLIEDEPDTVDVTVASLDDPNSLAPEFHIYCSSAVAWLTIDDELPRYSRSRKNETEKDGA